MAVLLLLAIIGIVAVLLFTSYAAAYTSVWGWRWTLKMPGGLRASIARGTPYVWRATTLDGLHILDDEHYEWVLLHGPGAVIKLTGERFVNIPKGTAAYRELAAAVANAELIEMRG